MTDNKKVLICGAGPCGLAVSFVLHQFGIPNLVIEKHPTTSIHPKARGVNVRTMEFIRQWGLEKVVREHEMTAKSRRLLWMDEVTGNLIGEIGLKDENLKYSPTTDSSVPQNFIEDALVEALADSPFSEVRFNTRLISFNQQDNHVTCELKNTKTSEQETLQFDYLVAADGAHSEIREALNIPMHGVASLGTYLTIFARTDLSAWLGDKAAVVYSFTGKNQMGRFLMAVDHVDQWIFGQRLFSKDEVITEDYCQKIVRSFVNDAPIDVKLISHSTWDMAALNAERYRQGRVFLVGDAAHRMPPTGGMGMNTGFAGAQNLAWKLAYVLKGYADDSLLSTYEAERQPVATFTLDWAGHNAKRMFQMHEAYHEGNTTLFNELLLDQERHVNHPGLDFGMIYRSDAVFSPDSQPVTIDPDTYTPAALPGMRAPHCEILMGDQQLSILNLFHLDYVLLLAEQASVDRAALPIPAGYPVKTYRHKADFVDVNHDFRGMYLADQYDAILVRPDGHVAWRKPVQKMA